MADEVKSDEIKIPSAPFKTFLDDMRRDMLDELEKDEKGIHYLLVAHGAGFAGCLAILKDYSVVSQLKGMGFFINLFGYGFLAAALAFIALTITRTEVVGALTAFTDKRETPTRKTRVASLVLSAISLALLFAAVVLICNKLAVL